MHRDAEQAIVNGVGVLRSNAGSTVPEHLGKVGEGKDAGSGPGVGRASCGVVHGYRQVGRPGFIAWQ